MNIKKQLNILDYTLLSLMRKKFKNLGIILVFTSVIFISGSVIFLSYSFRREAMLVLKDAPELIIQKMTAGRHELIPENLSASIMKIPGVAKVVPRYWGYYYDSLVKANYTVIAESGPLSGKNSMLRGRIPGKAAEHEAAIGRGIARARFVEIDDRIALQSADGGLMDFRVVGIFEEESELLTSDLIIVTAEDFRGLFSFPEGMATDLIVTVNNETEAPVIARKVKERFHGSRPILRSEIVRTYDAVFGWRSGMVLALFGGALVAFAILAWDKATGLSAEEKKEIGVLKAIGWETSDILLMKFWEGLAISVSAFLPGMIFAYIHVFIFGAPFFAPALKGWSVIYPDFRLAPFINPYQLATLLCLTVVPYIAATIIPSWKAAITDPDEVVRG